MCMEYDEIAKHAECGNIRVVFYENCTTASLECSDHAEVLAEADKEEEYV